MTGLPNLIDLGSQDAGRGRQRRFLASHKALVDQQKTEVTRLGNISILVEAVRAFRQASTVGALAARRSRGEWPRVTNLGPRLIRYSLGDPLHSAPNENEAA
jgi:hypothetical protein